MSANSLAVNRLAADQLETPLGGQREARADTLARWVHRYGPEVFRCCRQLLKSNAAAEDAMQTVFLQALQNFEHFREPGAERQWLLSIARHRCLDRLKHARRRSSVEAWAVELTVVLPDGEGNQALDAPADTRPADELLAQAETARLVRQSLEALGEATRLALVLRFQEQLPYQAIAELTGSTEGALRVRVLRGLAQLKESLTRSGFCV